MSDRWFILKNGETVGPLTAEQVRASLRDGTFDPFDMVMRDGSQVRRELVEVDELFQSAPVVYDASAQGQGSARHDGGPGMNATELVAGNGHMMLADSSAESYSRSSAASAPAKAKVKAPEARKKRRDPRHFHIMDGRGRMMGPMTASEIQGLYYKGVLDKSVKVMRDSSGAKVPVQKFIAVYSEAQANKVMQQGAHPALQGGLSVSAQHRLAIGKRIKRGARSKVSPVIMVAVVLGVLLSAIALWIALGPRPEMSARKTPAPVRVQRVPDAGPVRMLPSTKRPSERRSPSALETQRAAREKAGRAAVAKKQRETSRQRDLLKQTQARRAAEAKLQRQRDQRQGEAKRAEQRRVAREKAARDSALKRERAALAEARRRPVAPVSLPPPPPAPTGVKSLQDGQTVSGLGPMSFDRSAVQACEGTCTVTFSGAGGSVRVAFFKAVWGPTLLSRSGPVYISGLVRKSGSATKIMLSQVK